MITYFDTSVLLKLILDDETGVGPAQELWTDSSFAVTAEIGYVEGRAALAMAHRSQRLSGQDLDEARNSFEALWRQLEIVVITRELIRDAGDLAESDELRGYDAVHLAAALLAAADVMATADQRLCAAAAKHGLNVANPHPT